MTTFNANAAWIYPAPKQFSPARQWMQRKNDAMLLNPEFKFEYNDIFAEKNINQL